MRENIFGINRNITGSINWLFDNLCPPVIRDSKTVMYLCFKAAFGKLEAQKLIEFKEKFNTLSPDELNAYYAVPHIGKRRPTDLNTRSIKYILDEVSRSLHNKDGMILDISCGSGFLSYALSPYGSVTGIDIYLPEALKASENPRFLQGNIESIEFPDDYFDIVISTHTLEHVRNLDRAISELRRVCKNKLIIALPCQREYRYTPDLHVHFFPYTSSFLRVMKNPKAKCVKLKGDIVYMEEKASSRR